jgi:hypothetical protein
VVDFETGAGRISSRDDRALELFFEIMNLWKGQGKHHNNG